MKGDGSLRERDSQGRFCTVAHEKFHKGYKVVYMPEHPHARANGYVYEHILVAEKKIGRQLLQGEVIHHIDGNKLNNYPENLMVFPNQSEHDKYHWNVRGRKYQAENGTVYTINEIATLSGAPRTAVYQRIKKLGWTVDEAISGKGKRKQRYEHDRMGQA